MLKYSRLLCLFGLIWGGTIAALTLNLEAIAQSTDLENALTVRSDIQEANSETGIITARGNVKIYYPARQIQATATQAQYFSKERRLVLTGNVYVLQNGNSMRAENMTYLIDQGRFIATPRNDQQVESIYIITDNQEEEPVILFEDNLNSEN
ncbi:MAG: OstA family protein [Gloeocapsa sp. DLM2.Bin57]|nr:MAG: OstA family protein [Gloeocapsa sp. DLM2.Bin57]